MPSTDPLLFVYPNPKAEAFVTALSLLQRQLMLNLSYNPATK